MNRILRNVASIMLMAVLFFVMGCRPEEPLPEPQPDPEPTPVPGDTLVPSGLPEVKTLPVSELTFNSVTVSGCVVSEGSSEVTERGICWGLSENPEVNGNVIPCGSGLGEFSYTITGLVPATAYSCRAYAKNSEGVSYGEWWGFFTDEAPVEYPNGILPGRFSIGPGRQVCFSQGNLQYQASTHTWRLAERQWDYVGGFDINSHYHGTVDGSVNNEISSTYDGWIDLFGWATSGWDCGNTNYHPWDYEYGASLYGPLGHDLTGEFANCDWGCYNAISNGGNQAGMWFTLSKEGWEYLLDERNTPSGMRFVKVVVRDSEQLHVNGLLLFPDDWDPEVNSYNFTHVNEVGVNWSSCVTISDWMLEHRFAPAGAVFLPAAGVRNIRSVVSVGSTLFYWTSSTDSNNSFGAHGLYDVANQFFSNGRDRSVGGSVRLVRLAE